jgi:hypothetical protein
MRLPNLHGTINQDKFFIYVACDSYYFDEFAVSLINSVKQNTSAGIHLHIFNPRQDQLDRFVHDNKVSVTYEYIHVNDFIVATNNLENLSTDGVDKFKYERSLNAMAKGKDQSLAERVMKTYFACARFVRLSELVNHTRNFFAIDIDAIVRKEIQLPDTDCDFFIHHISGRKSRFLAGGMLFLNNYKSLEFLNQYADILKHHIEEDHLYWSLDQDVLDLIVPKFNYGNLPLTYIDWNMGLDSMIWTAKGERKNLSIFLDEKTKYIS